jgi:hypothetical protein
MVTNGERQLTLPVVLPLAVCLAPGVNSGLGSFLIFDPFFQATVRVCCSMLSSTVPPPLLRRRRQA